LREPAPSIATCASGRTVPTTDPKTHRGASSPEKPHFTIPDPLSHTTGVGSSSV
jgi:hypothetical protein